MDWASTYQYLDREDIIECDFCGCVFKIKVYKQKAHNDNEDYYCPECKKRFWTRGSITPEIQKISDRTDGRICNYTNEELK